VILIGPSEVASGSLIDRIAHELLRRGCRPCSQECKAQPTRTISRQSGGTQAGRRPLRRVAAHGDNPFAGDSFGASRHATSTEFPVVYIRRHRTGPRRSPVPDPVSTDLGYTASIRQVAARSLVSLGTDRMAHVRDPPCLLSAPPMRNRSRTNNACAKSPFKRGIGPARRCTCRPDTSNRH